ncbi:hypothetical protein PVK06_017657 [Gossypium arboreum]|uniref:Small ribosomal subunit protein uS15c n=1 Tax=Gossypium arboreum TaxID=29729 RepID=A0ABR0Q4F9_GOSAR|nr:hypothetical protein PVK06_017657 [Gossypium arboreum]
MTENKDKNHYDLFVPENILSPNHRRELRIQISFNSRDKNEKKEEKRGSVEFQIVSFTNKIRRLISHLELHKKDYLSQRGLRKILGKRQRLLSYLSKTNKIRYKELIDGEDVVDCEPILGYLHRGMEKIAENRTIIQYLPYVTHWDYLATMFTEAITVNGPEQLGNIQVPKRASYIRVIMLELSRIASHLLWLGPFMADIGAQTPLFYIFRERELVYDLFEATTERVEGIGITGGEEAINWGLSGPMVRASGIKWDLRKVDHHECYDEFDWEIQWQKEGDSLARYLVRISEMTESIKIIQQALEGISGGPYENLEIQCFDRERDPEWNDFEYRFISKKPSPTFELPRQELYVRMEAPKGELGIFLIGDQSSFPWRWKIRPPGFINL